MVCRARVRPGGGGYGDLGVTWWFFFSISMSLPGLRTRDSNYSSFRTSCRRNLTMLTGKRIVYDTLPPSFCFCFCFVFVFVFFSIFQNNLGENSLHSPGIMGAESTKPSYLLGEGDTHWKVVQGCAALKAPFQATFRLQRPTFSSPFPAPETPLPFFEKKKKTCTSRRIFADFD